MRRCTAADIQGPSSWAAGRTHTALSGGERQQDAGSLRERFPHDARTSMLSLPSRTNPN